MSELYGIDREKSLQGLPGNIINVTHKSDCPGDDYTYLYLTDTPSKDSDIILNQWYFINLGATRFGLEGGDQLFIENNLNFNVFWYVIYFDDPLDSSTSSTNSTIRRGIIKANSSDRISAATHTDCLFCCVKMD